MLSLGSSKCDGIGDLIKCLVLCLWDEEENEDDGCSQDDREHNVGVLLEPILEKKKRKQMKNSATCRLCRPTTCACLKEPDLKKSLLLCLLQSYCLVASSYP